MKIFMNEKIFPSSDWLWKSVFAVNLMMFLNEFNPNYKAKKYLDIKLLKVSV